MFLLWVAKAMRTCCTSLHEGCHFTKAVQFGPNAKLWGTDYVWCVMGSGVRWFDSVNRFARNKVLFVGILAAIDWTPFASVLNIGRPRLGLLIIDSTSSTAQGGGGSFKKKKPIGEVGCCKSQMAERIHWWTKSWLESELCFLEWLQWLQWLQRSPHHNCWMQCGVVQL